MAGSCFCPTERTLNRDTGIDLSQMDYRTLVGNYVLSGLIAVGCFWMWPRPRTCWQLHNACVHIESSHVEIPQLLDLMLDCAVLQNSPVLCLQPFLGALWGMFWVIVLLEHPWPLKQTQLSDTRPYIVGQNLLIVSKFHDSLHTINASSARGSKTTSKHLWTSTIFDCRQRWDQVTYVQFLSKSQALTFKSKVIPKSFFLAQVKSSHLIIAILPAESYLSESESKKTRYK